jgi:hypothetical protein
LIVDQMEASHMVAQHIAAAMRDKMLDQTYLGARPAAVN